jgi:8-hydroxy-5-deazaflavin:NADPH oxidoreductase
MKIAILGAGNIGGTLGKKWLANGHEVVFGVRDANSPKTLQALESAKGAAVTSLSEAIDGAEVILFSTPWATVPEIASANTNKLDGKIILDATNNFAGPVINNLSALEKAAPNGKIYRAFNSLGWELFANPTVGSEQVDMFYSGPDGETRPVVEKLIAEIGLRPVWVGGNDRIVLVDNLGALWVDMVFQQGWKRHTALKVVSG